MVQTRSACQPPISTIHCPSFHACISTSGPGDAFQCNTAFQVLTKQCIEVALAVDVIFGFRRRARTEGKTWPVQPQVRNGFQEAEIHLACRWPRPIGRVKECTHVHHQIGRALNAALDRVGFPGVRVSITMRAAGRLFRRGRLLFTALRCVHGVMLYCNASRKQEISFFIYLLPDECYPDRMWQVSELVCNYISRRGRTPSARGTVLMNTHRVESSGRGRERTSSSSSSSSSCFSSRPAPNCSPPPTPAAPPPAVQQRARQGDSDAEQELRAESEAAWVLTASNGDAADREITLEHNALVGLDGGRPHLEATAEMLLSEVEALALHFALACCAGGYLCLLRARSPNFSFMLAHKRQRTHCALLSALRLLPLLGLSRVRSAAPDPRKGPSTTYKSLSMLPL